MRYSSAGDGQMLRRASLGPAELLRRRRQPITAPVRGRALRGLGIGVQEGVGAGQGAAQGAAQGASVGSVIPLVGTAIGAIAGAVIGAVAGSLGKKDPEDANFQQAQAMGQVNPQSVLNIANKYLVLAGLFDLQPGQIKGNIPIYRKYGRMGEQRFVTDMVNLIYQAAVSGAITANDTPQSVFQRIVQPWIDSFGYGAMSDSNAQMITYILMGMVAEYIVGQQSYWLDINGSNPFASLPKFPMSRIAGVQPAAPTSPVPVVSPASNALPAPVSKASPSMVYLIAPDLRTLTTPQGNFSFGPAYGQRHGADQWILVNDQKIGAGNWLGFDGTNVTLQAFDGSTYLWQNGGWVPTGFAPLKVAAPSAMPVAPPASTPAATAPSVSAPYVSYSLTSGVSSSGLPIFQGSDGQLYERLLNGAFSLYTGTVTQPAPSSAVQPSTGAPTAGAVQAATTPAYSAPGLYQPVASAPAQASLAPTGGNELWLWLGGLAVLGVLLFKGAHAK